MVGCAVQNCSNYSDKTGNIYSFHSFPKNKEFRDIWINCCKRADKFNPNSVRICSKHFPPEYFERDLQFELMGGIPKRKTLKKEAVPTLFLPNFNHDREHNRERRERANKREAKREIDGIIKGSGQKRQRVEEKEFEKSHNVDINIEKENNNAEKNYPECSTNESSSGNESLRKSLEMYKIRCGYLEKTLAKERRDRIELQKTVRILQKKIENFKSQMLTKEEDVTEKIRKILSNVFTAGQIQMLLGSKKRTRWENEDIEVALTLRSLSLRTYNFLRRKIKLPLPGISTLSKWTRNFSCLPGYQEIVLSVMKARGAAMAQSEKFTVLSFDEMNLDSRMSYDRRDDKVYGPHSNVQVAMARGLKGNWKQIVYYGFDQKMTKEIIINIVSKLSVAGFRVVAIVCDMGGGNQSLWNSLGISTSKTCFDVSSSHKIWVFGDMPHLIKLLRNHLLDDGIFLPQNIFVGKQLIQTVIEENELKLAPKLQRGHLEVRGSLRQNVRLAYQLFSHHTATLLKMKFPENIHIGNFFDLTDKFIDIFNSCQFKDSNKFKCAFGVHLSEQLQTLNEMENVVQKMRIGEKKKFLPFQKGLLISINSIKHLYTSLTTDDELGKEITYIFTRRLTQDILESTFSRIRGVGHQYSHPLPTEFKNRLKLLFLGSRLPLPQGSNVSEDDRDKTTYLTASMFKSLPLIVEEEKKEHEADQDDYTAELSTVEEQALRYLAGYLVKDETVSDLKEAEEKSNDGWIEKLSHGNLTIPSKAFTETVKKADQIFRRIHGHKLIKESGVVQKYLDALKTTFPSVNKKILLKLARTRTFIRLRFLNEQQKRIALERKLKNKNKQWIKSKKALKQSHNKHK